MFILRTPADDLSQIKDLQYATSQPIGFAIQCFVTALVSLGISFYHAWSMTLITLVAVPVSTVVLAWISARLQPFIDGHLLMLTNATKLASVGVSDIDAIKNLNGQKHEVSQYSRAIRKAARYFLAQAHGNAIQIGFVRVVTLGMFVQGFW